MEPQYQSTQQKPSYAAAESEHFQTQEVPSLSLLPPPLQLKASVIQRDCGEDMSCEQPAMSIAPPTKRPKRGPNKNLMGMMRNNLGSMVSWGIKSGSAFIGEGIGAAGNALSSGIDKIGDMAQSGGKSAGSLAAYQAQTIGNMVESGGNVLGSAIDIGGEALGNAVQILAPQVPRVIGKLIDKGGEGVGKGIARTGRTLNSIARSGGRKMKYMAKYIGRDAKGRANWAKSGVKKVAGFGKSVAEQGGEFIGNAAERGVKGTIENDVEVLSSLLGGIEGAREYAKKKAFGDALAAAGLSLVDASLDDKLGAWDAIVGPKGEEMTSEALAPQVKIDEMLAHDMAYWTNMNEEKAQQLDQMGYDPASLQPVSGTRDFSMVYIMPKPGSGQLPVVAFTGTNSGRDHKEANINPIQVGHEQFQENKQIIDAVFRQVGDRVVVVGHSLGGALAKIATAEYTSQVARMTTFQAPGIAQSTKNQFDRNKSILKAERKETPEISMHLSHNDIVSHAGETDFDGPQYLHDKGDIDSFSAHTSTLMDDDIHKVTKYESYPFPLRRKAAEAIRSGVGTIIGGDRNE